MQRRAHCGRVALGLAVASLLAAELDTAAEFGDQSPEVPSERWFLMVFLLRL